MNAVDYLKDFGFEYKERGNELYIKFCPNCEEEHEGDFTHLSFNSQIGLFSCKKCRYAGNLWKFAGDRGHYIAKADGEKTFYRPEIDKSMFENAVEFLDWYAKKRGIQKQTFNKYKVGNQRTNEKSYAVYHFYDMEGRLLNRKYRNSIDKKDQHQDKNTEKNYYGLQFVNRNNKELYVCEGEDDCHALDEMGFENAVSLPSGAQSYTPGMDNVNMLFDTIYLLFDNDSTGQAGAKEFSMKAGVHKCMNVVLPYKDARDCLQQGLNAGDLSRYISESQPFTLPEIAKASELFNNEATQTAFKTTNQKFNKFLGGMRGGEVTVLTGHSGHGKTTAACNIALWAALDRTPVFMLSFENVFKSIIYKMIQANTGENIFEEDVETGMRHICVSDDWMKAQLAVLDTMPLWFLNSRTHDGYFDLSAIENLCTYATKFNNIKVHIIDNLHYILKIKNASAQVLEIDESIRKISYLAKKTNSHIILIAHPYKTENPQTGKLAKLGLYCIKGSSTIVQECSNFIVVEKGGEDFDLKSHWRTLKCREGRTQKIIFDVSDNLNRME